MNKIINELRKKINDNRILENELMSNHTSYKTGGPCDVMIVPESADDISNAVSICKNNNVPLYTFGNCTNILVSDKGIRGVVLKISKNFNQVEIKNNLIIAKAGLLLSALANKACEHSLAGLEFASGIPGTVGGAVSMNAGAYGGEMKDVLKYTKYIDEDGNIKEITNDEHNFGYRKSIFSNNKYIIVECGFELENGSKDAIRARMSNLNSRRRQKQPLTLPSCGSVFKRPEGYYAGKLIEDSGLKGYNINGARVSTKHAGFIVNEGGATSEDIKKLIEHVQKTVYNKFKVKLETEVKIIGE